ncbi:hypothetical protein IMCC21906_01351 [Spongiibacter sp. IMCC21906]|nr:hypothetical protein IMCC21906_01351 [Spongiibacter sp. IMCC21906]
MTSRIDLAVSNILSVEKGSHNRKRRGGGVATLDLFQRDETKLPAVVTSFG